MATEPEVEAAAQAGAAILAAEDLWADLPSTARRVVEAALVSFADRGFHATTLKHIAAGSGLSTAALYGHFSSKDDLLYTLSLRGHESALAVVQAAAALRPRAHAFRTLVYAFARWHAEQQTVGRVVQYQINALRKDHSARIAALRRQIEQITRAAVSAVSGEAPVGAVDSRGITAAVLSLGIDVARWYRPGGRYSPDDIGRMHCELASRLICGVTC